MINLYENEYLHAFVVEAQNQRQQQRQDGHDKQRQQDREQELVNITSFRHVFPGYGFPSVQQSRFFAQILQLLHRSPGMLHGRAIILQLQSNYFFVISEYCGC